MSTIITKNSSTASAVPAAGDLTKGELAINVTDKKLYTKDNSATVVKIVGSLGNQEANAVAITGGTVAGITDLAVADGGTGASSAADARTNLGVTATGADTTYAFRANNLSDLASASTARTNLGLGTIATQAASTVTITGGSISGITDLAVADGGTGASTAANARTNLGAAASGANSDITSLSGLTTALSVAQGGTGVTASTGTGSVVLSNSPTLVTPALGTPASATLTNATGLPIATGVSGLGTGVATALAVSVGSAGAPLVNGGVLGTPSSGTATNLTGLPISTGVSGLGAGVATFLGTPSSANLASAVTDETGTGALVFANSPTLITPALGTPSSGTATNLTGLPLSTGVTGTLPIANGGTGTATPSLVAGTNVTITGTWPNQTIAASGGGGSGDVVGPASSTDNAFARFDGTTGKLLQNSIGATLSDTGGASFTGSVDVAGTSTAGSNIKLYEDTDNGTNYVSFKAPDTIASNVTWTLPTADGTNGQVLATNGTGTLSWSSASGSSQWTTSGSDIYYTTGKVGVGVSSFTSGGGKLEVSDGITFPATQSASSNANTLDDYEEGTWTPTQGAGLTVVGAFSSSGTYTKIGRQVYVTGFLQGATSTSISPNSILAGGLPFTVAGGGFYNCGSGTNSGLSSGIVVMVFSGSTNIYSAGTLNTSGGNLQFSAVYYV